MVDRNFLIQCNKFMKQVEEWPEPCVLVTVNSGNRVFCSGYNLKYWAAGPNNTMDTFRMMQIFLARLITINVQTLCVVNGFAVAGGVFIALAHDKCIMNSDPTFKCFLNETANSMPINQSNIYQIESVTSGATARRLALG